MFAQSMMTGSVGGSGWTPEGEMVSIQIDGRPAYRLLVQNPLSNGCGYVAESNGRTGKNEAGKLSLFKKRLLLRSSEQPHDTLVANWCGKLR
jgi:hypothetical protein